MRFGKGDDFEVVFCNYPSPLTQTATDDECVVCWVKRTELYRKGEPIIERKTVEIADETIQRVTVSFQDWSPIYCWIFGSNSQTEHITRLSRKQNDFRELGVLLERITKT